MANLARVIRWTTSATLMALPAVPALAQTCTGLPVFPTGSVTTTQDRDRMMCLLGLTYPVLPTRVTDPNRPLNGWPTSAANPEGNWTDALGHTIVRGIWGSWITYDDSQSGGAATGNPQVRGTSTGGAMSGYGDMGPVQARPYPAPFCSSPGCAAATTYSPLELLKMKDKVTPVTSTTDWWLKRRPELFDLVQKQYYGYTWPRAEWPEISWVVGAVTTGTANGVAYRQKTITGTVSTASYPALRNVPRISLTCRTPADKAGQKVPVFIQIAGSVNIWQYVAAGGFGACGYNATQLQPDSGGANLSSYIVGLFNKGDWRKPTDPGSLVAWAWGISRAIDYFATDPDIDEDKVAIEGHSRYGKATTVAAAYDERIVAAFASDAGAMGTSPARRHFGQSLESVAGSTSEYHWVNGNINTFAGPLVPGGYIPRKVENLDVDSYAVVSLIAPRAFMAGGGTDTPAGNGNAWADPRGMFLGAALATPAYELLGWPGMVVPPGTVFTSNPTPYNSGESIGGRPPFDVPLIEGTLAWRSQKEGHVDNTNWPTFVSFASRYLNNTRPVVAAGQSFGLPALASSAVGTLTGTPGGAGPLQNWQVKGGNGAYVFDLNRNTGALSIPDRSKLDAAISSYSLTVMAGDGLLPSHDKTVTVQMPADLAASGITTAAKGGFVFNFTTGRFNHQVIVTNRTQNPVPGPLSLVADSLSSNATLFNASGATGSTAPLGSPYVTLAGGLAPGQSATVTLQFTNPSKTAITYTPRVLAGATPR